MRSEENASIAGSWISMRHIQRAAVFMRSVNLDADAILAAHGLNVERLADGDSKVALEVCQDLFPHIQDVLGDPLTPLLMAQNVQPSAMGVLGFLMQSCETLGDLLGVMRQFRGVMSNVGRVSVVYAPGSLELRWECLAGNARFRHFVYDYIMGTSHVMRRLLVPDAADWICVRLAHPGPSADGDRRRYVDFFGCPVHFNCPHNALVGAADILSERLPYSNSALKDALTQHTHRLWAQRAEPSSFTNDVRRIINTQLMTGVVTQENVARQLGTSIRSLHRRLEELGTSYSEQLDAIRLNMAREQLSRGDTPISDLADRLGFSSQQTFTRWFRSASGVAPGQYRQQTLGKRDTQEAHRL